MIALGGSDLYAGTQGAARLAAMRQFSTDLVRLGAAAEADAISLHAYPWGVYDDAVQASYQDELTFQRETWGLPVWITETGHRANERGTQDGYLVAAYRLFLDAGVDRLFWFSLSDQPDGEFGIHGRPAQAALRELVGYGDGRGTGQGRLPGPVAGNVCALPLAARDERTCSASRAESSAATVFPTFLSSRLPRVPDDVPDGRHAGGGDGPRPGPRVEAAQHGDQDAFMDLVGSRGDRLFAIAYRILRDVDRAEDALQDALVIAWRDLRSVRDPDRVDAWMNRVVTNVCIAHATRERRRTVNLRVLPGEGPAAPDGLLRLGDRDQLERGFRRLTPDERAVLVLHHYAGYTLAEIADSLGVPAGTVRSRLHHAHRAMRAALEADARTAVGGQSA